MTLAAREFLVWLVIGGHLMLINGCTVTRQVSVDESEIAGLENARILRVILKSGEIVQFGREGGRYVESSRDGKSGGVIVGLNVESKLVEIDPVQAVDVQAEKTSIDAARTFLLILSVPVAVGALVFAYFIILFSSHSGPR